MPASVPQNPQAEKILTVSAANNPGPVLSLRASAVEPDALRNKTVLLLSTEGAAEMASAEWLNENEALGNAATV